jgi:hypothetical protein
VDVATKGPRSSTACERRLPLGAVDLAVAVGLAAGVALLLRSSLEVWFTYDDFFQLRYVGRHDWRELLASRASHAELPTSMVTPLLFLSLALDRRWFGLDAFAFQVHQLAAYALVVAALYLVARLWHGRVAAAGVALLASLGTATTGLVPLLMVRHYVEGALAALVATGLYVAAVRARERRPALLATIGSTVAYAVAALAKEVFVPLPILLAALPEGDVRTRARRLAPYAAVVVGYALYRRWLLGAWGGGYGWEVDAAALPGLVARLPGRLLAEAAIPGGAAGVAVVASVTLSTAVLALVHRRARAAVVVAMLVLLAPLVPVATEVESRWAAAPWIALSFGAAALLGRSKVGARRLGWATLLLLAAVAHARAWPRTLGELGRISKENLAFLHLGPDDVLRSPASPPEALVELARFKESELGLGPPPGWFTDDWFACSGRIARRRIWQYEAASGAVVERTRRARREARQHCRSIRGDAPLEVRFVWHGSSLRWELGPRTDGIYSAVFGEGVSRVELPRRGGFRRAGSPPRLRVRYDAPEGWVTYSEELDVAPEGELVWSRDG